MPLLLDDEFDEDGMLLFVVVDGRVGVEGVLSWSMGDGMVVDVVQGGEGRKRETACLAVSKYRCCCYSL